MIEVGKKIVVRIESGEKSVMGEQLNAPVVGTVIWVHTKKRFYTVQFPNGLRESYSMR